MAHLGRVMLWGISNTAYQFNRPGARMSGSVYSLFAILIFCTIACHSSSRPPIDTGSAPVTRTVTKADLVITNVEITPPVVKVGTPSSFNVYVNNNGNATSADFNVNIHARHAGNMNESIGCCSPIHMRGVQAGEKLNVYTGNVGINDPGSYELVVDLKLTDGTTVEKLWPFSGVGK